MPTQGPARRRSRAEATSIPRLVLEPPSTLELAVRSVLALMATQPQAAVWLVRTLVSEGKAFARQPPGQDLLRRLRQEAWVEKGRVLWEACGLDSLLDGEASPVPIAPLLRRVRPELERVNLEALLTKLMLARKGGPNE